MVREDKTLWKAKFFTKIVVSILMNLNLNRRNVITKPFLGIGRRISEMFYRECGQCWFEANANDPRLAQKLWRYFDGQEYDDEESDQRSFGP